MLNLFGEDVQDPTLRTVKAYGSATVRACGNAYCSSWSLMECKLSNNALYRVQSTNTVYYANDSMKFRKQEGGAG